MPFLWVSGAARVDEAKLGQRLCPYAGGVQRRTFGSTSVWHTSLGRWVSPSLLQLPVLADELVHRSNCSAFGEVEVVRAGFRFSTDVLGTLPLWKLSGDGFVAVSCEVKAFTAIDGVQVTLRGESELLAPGERPPTYSPYVNVERLAPGSQWEVRDGRWVEVGPSAWPALLASPSGQARDTSALGDALNQTFGELETEKGGAFISGGIDSSIASVLLSGRVRPLPFHTWSLGTRVGDEFGQAAEQARHLRSLHHEEQLLDGDVLRLWRDVIFSNEIVDGMTAEIVLQLEALVQQVGGRATDIATGYGADLLFGGMLRHEAYMKAVGVETTPALIARTWWTGELSPFYAWRHGVAVHPVFWSAAVIRAALALDPESHFDGRHEKVPLRQLAVARGWLTEPLAFRPKVGMTVGTAAYQLVAEQLGLSSVTDYAGRSRQAIALWRAMLEDPQAGRS